MSDELTNELNAMIHAQAREILLQESAPRDEARRPGEAPQVTEGVDELEERRSMTKRERFFVITPRGKVGASSEREALTVAHNASKSTEEFISIVNANGKQVAIYRNGKLVKDLGLKENEDLLDTLVLDLL